VSTDGQRPGEGFQYIVSFPEWEQAGHIANTHDATYAKAAQKGQRMLDFLVSSAQQNGEPLPTPTLFDTHAYAPGETVEDLVRETKELLRELDVLDTPQPEETPHLPTRGQSGAYFVARAGHSRRSGVRRHTEEARAARVLVEASGGLEFLWEVGEHRSNYSTGRVWCLRWPFACNHAASSASRGGASPS
jgi:predicted RNase H-like HicB family nuclease